MTLGGQKLNRKQKAGLMNEATAEVIRIGTAHGPGLWQRHGGNHRQYEKMIPHRWDASPSQFGLGSAGKRWS